MPGLTRRTALVAIGGALASASLRPGAGRSQELLGGLRGSLDASREGVVPGSPDDQSAALKRALAKAAASGQPLFLPPGQYQVAGIELPTYAHMIGVAGQTRLVFRGGPFMLRAANAGHVTLEGVTLDGAGRPLDSAAPALLEAAFVERLALDGCDVSGSAGGGLALRACAGRVERCRIGQVRGVGLDLTNSRGMAVEGNVVSECGETGILVYRDTEGNDGTIVRGNRVAAIRAQSGGTGQYGNGINVAKANGVIVADNRVDDCDFSAIRCFSSDDVSVSGNIATRSGEVAVYVEFAFEGAVVADNLIDEAAYGIAFANFMTYGGRLAVCSGNVVRNISGVSRLPRGNDPLSGAGIGAEADIAIAGNVIDNARRGIELGYGPYLRDASATGNVIRGCPIGIGVTVVEGAGSALISGNLISGADKGAIVGLRWEEIATGDLGRAGAESFPHLTIEGNRIT